MKRVLTVVIVMGCIALPRSGGADDKPAPKDNASEILKFADITALWKPDDKKKASKERYVAELERGAKGHYDFYFQNPSETPAQLGLVEATCDCSHVEVTFLTKAEAAALNDNFDHETLTRLLPKKLEWQRLKKDPRHEQGVAVPGKAKGLVRVAWEARKPEGEALNLAIRLWMRTAQGSVETTELEIPTTVVAVVQFQDREIKLGELTEPRTLREFLCWSATREKLELSLAPGADDGAFEWRLTALNANECQDLQARLEKTHRTRVKAGYRVSLTVHQSRKGVQPDQGGLSLHAPLLLDGQPLGLPGPLFSGSVRGDVDIAGDVQDGGTVEQGQIRLGAFKASRGMTAKLVLRADPKVQLEIVPRGAYPRGAAPPPYLKLGKLMADKELVQNKKVWRLEVTLDAGVPTGPLPATAAVLLRAKSSSPRQLRIPIIGQSSPD